MPNNSTPIPQRIDSSMRSDGTSNPTAEAGMAKPQAPRYNQPLVLEMLANYLSRQKAFLQSQNQQP